MGESMEGENAAFWLPTHFLTDDDFFSGDHHHHKLPLKSDLLQNQKCFDFFNNNNNNNSAGFGFGSDPFDSPLSSPDNDENMNENDDAFILSQLTRHFAQTSIYDSHTSSEKPWLFSTSPQSTLSGFGGGWSSNNRSGFSSNGSPNGPSRVPSPPLTPELKNDAAWDLLYEAAGQVARLKMNAIAAQMNNKTRGLLAAPPPRHVSGLTPSYNSQYQELKWAQNNNLGRQEREGNCYCRHHHHHHNNNHQQVRSCGGLPSLSQTAWPPLTRQPPHHHNHNHQLREASNCGSQMRSLYQGASGGVGPTMGGVKRQSAGTGVFLPRQHHHHQSFEPRKKPTVVIPSRSVHQELEEPNLINSHSRFGGAGFPTDYEMRMAKRNAILGHQRRSLARGEAMVVGPGHEIRLPNDWTY